MSNNHTEHTEDRLGISIEVVIKDGEVLRVSQNGQEVRAVVRDYDVVFPCVAHHLDKDADGEYYTETIV